MSKKPLNLLASFIFLFFSVQWMHAEEIVTKLKARQPNWRMEIIETYSQGIPSKVLFFEPISGSDHDTPVKQMTYRQDSTLASETDLVVFEEPGAEAQVLPHGPSLTYSHTGTIESIIFYIKGIQQGPARSYYPSGVLKSYANYKNGVLKAHQKHIMKMEGQRKKAHI